MTNYFAESCTLDISILHGLRFLLSQEKNKQNNEILKYLKCRNLQISKKSRFSKQNIGCVHILTNNKIFKENKFMF